MRDIMSWDFPIYRKYVGVDVWYRISSLDEFTEIKQVGESLLLANIKAEQYPEKLRIQDMLNCHENRWEELDAHTFETLEKKLI